MVWVECKDLDVENFKNCFAILGNGLVNKKNLWIKNYDDSKDHGDEVYFLNKIIKIRY